MREGSKVARTLPRACAQSWCVSRHRSGRGVR